MINKVATKWLKTWNACEYELELGIEWFKKQYTSDPAELIEILIKEERWDWVYKCFENLITKEQAVDWAIYTCPCVPRWVDGPRVIEHRKVEGKMRAWTLEDEVKLMGLWRDRSLSVAEIGRRLHRHPSSVQWKVRELKIPRDRNYVKPPPEPEKPLPVSGYGYRGELKAGGLL